jgi:hypothetical protein
MRPIPLDSSEKMSGFEMTCANKTRGGLITRVGGDGWSLDIRDAIMKLLTQQIVIYIRTDNQLIQIGVRGQGSDAYLALEPEGFPLHNLTDLPSC